MTPKKAIWRGLIMIKVLPVLVCAAIIMLSILLFGIGWQAGVIAALAMTLLVCSRYYLSIRWYIWALQHVENARELRQKAILAGLNPKENVNNQITSSADIMRLKELVKKIEEPARYNDNPDIPAETRIYMAKTGKTLMLIVMLVVFCAGIVIVVTTGSYLAGSIICVVSGWLIFDSLRTILNQQPQIIINSLGIETTASGFHNWKEIKNEIIVAEKRGRNATTYFLVYDFDGGGEDYPLYDIGISPGALANLLQVYKGRSMK